MTEHDPKIDSAWQDESRIQGNSLEGFFYELLRDHLSPGIIEKLVREAEQESMNSFSNPHLARYAKEIAHRLLKANKICVTPLSVTISSWAAMIATQLRDRGLSVGDGAPVIVQVFGHDMVQIASINHLLNFIFANGRPVRWAYVSPVGSSHGSYTHQEEFLGSLEDLVGMLKERLDSFSKHVKDIL